MLQSEQTVFYYIENAIKSYRQFAQKKIKKAGLNVTIDQGLILNIIQNNPTISQQEIARRAFKDHASVTRIIESMVEKNILKREFHTEDRRRFQLTITDFGIEILTNINPIVTVNRNQALYGITEEEIETVKKVLQRIMKNCS
ncbi:MarR family winged helix-turn-helix transcriptional regulator [Chryseobacterium daeguense]|uniref:MarR family winged helix-turn-helix transcriptional regulator n=1 Tax=Chryseobacterium daeguense TaxID=412438 RepID=UPI000482C163|nr:MarR family transcriptional regulator [Chryseobacterium daeguense]